MTIHVDFVGTSKTKYGCVVEYTFIDRHTSEEIAFGSYNGAKGFEVIDLRTAGVQSYDNAAVAWITLNKMLVDEYGY